MKFYFELQFKRIERKFSDFGVHPILGVLIAILGFVLLSTYLFQEIQYAYGIYLMLAFSLLSNLSEKKRNDQLKLIFKSNQYIQIRLIENSLMIIPFMMVLGFFGYGLWGLVLVVIAGLLAILNQFKSFGFVVKTPFKRIPFENIVGFRRVYLILIAIYLLLLKSIQVQNYNLGLFALGMVFLITMSFYIRAEEKYFVWIYSNTPQQFLLRKIRLGLLASSVLSLIPVIVLIGYYPENLWMTVLIQGIGFVFMVTVILAKYSAYPNEMGLGQAVLLGVSLWFPPMLLGVVPYFYVKSKEQLELVLNDKNNRVK
ncbi:hypothetical protein KFE94_09490 [bacterium SCSIO 12643]|nr:hypothetical protein KFE94_09490 [bacterium SCSIO 12643]